MKRSTLAPSSRYASRLRVPGSLYSPLGPIRVSEGPLVDCRGVFYPGDHTIILDPNLSPEMKMQTVGHELMHSILFEHGLENHISAKTQEALCDVFGTWLVGAILSGAVTIKEPQP